MTVYRPKVEVTMPGGPTETYFAPFVTWFPSFKSAAKHEEDFVNQARFLYYLQHVGPNENLTEDKLEDLQSQVTYKKLTFHPIRNLIRRIECWCMYRI